MNKSRLVRVLEAKLEVAGLFMARPGKQKAHCQAERGSALHVWGYFLRVPQGWHFLKEQLLFVSTDDEVG